MIKTIEFRPENGEDKGKLFIINRFTAFEGDRWARKVVKALAKAGGRLPPETVDLWGWED